MRRGVVYACLLLIIPLGVLVAGGPFLLPRTVVHTTSATIDNRFDIIVLPDSQFEVGFTNDDLADEVTWIIDNAAQDNIKMVVSEGDVINDASCSSQWQFAAKQFARLDVAGIPYILDGGNHDVINYRSVSDACPPNSGSDVWVHGQFWDRYFPLSRFQAMPTYGGSMNSSSLDLYETFTVAPGLNFLALSLPFGPTNAEIAWANSVITSHPDYKVLITTHDYLGDDGQLRGNRANILGYGNDSDAAYGRHAHTQANCLWYYESGHCDVEGALPGHPGGTPMPGAHTGYWVWHQVVASHPNVKFVFSGHVIAHEGMSNGKPVKLTNTGAPLASRSYLTHSDGSQTYQYMFNAQMYRGGDGYFRILQFNPTTDKFAGLTQSASGGPPLTDTNDQFVVSGWI